MVGFIGRGMRPVLPQRLDWPSIIGLFILNFGTLELALMDCLKRRLPEERWYALTKKSFHEWVNCLRCLAAERPEMVAKKQQWDSLIHKLESLRDLRNLLAHSTLVHTLADDGVTCTQTLSFTAEVSASKEVSQKVTFEDLLSQGTVLVDLTDELMTLGCEMGTATA